MPLHRRHAAPQIRDPGFFFAKPGPRICGAPRRAIAAQCTASGERFSSVTLMRGSSLATRLFLSATAWVVVILLLTGIVLSSVYRNATERAFDRRLNLYLRTLVAEAATPDDPQDKDAQSLGEPLFELPLSGWYWSVVRADADHTEVKASRSLWDKKLPRLEDQGVELTPSGIRLGYVDGPEGQNLRMVERPVDLGSDGKFLVSVAGDASEIFEEIRSFDYSLGGTFVALAIVLGLTTIFQVRFGLAPLKRISDSIADIRSGRAERLEGVFPVEIAPLARETNALIDANRAIVERARTHVGNLAHAIKTPLSVIVNEAGGRSADPFAAKVLEQADVMRDQVAHHLERARIAARLTIVGTITEVAPAIEALRRTMEKVHRDRDLMIELEADASAKFRGERQDLDEMVGNLVDNACKWAQSHVFIEVTVERQNASDPAPKLRIIVDDDGKGLSAAERAQVARRGQRLDESKPGSGLGLSIVVDLAALYGGSLTLGTAPIGGLRAELVLPGV
jgi:signal transduction histidine kinase